MIHFIACVSPARDFCIVKFMSVIIIILSISLLIAGGFLIGFIWGVKDGQFEDDFSPANRILFDNTSQKK